MKYGLFTSPSPGYYGIGDEHAKVGTRGWYRTRWEGQAPRGFFRYAEAVLKAERAPMTGTAIADGFTNYRRQTLAQAEA